MKKAFPPWAANSGPLASLAKRLTTLASWVSGQFTARQLTPRQLTPDNWPRDNWPRVTIHPETIHPGDNWPRRQLTPEQLIPGQLTPGDNSPRYKLTPRDEIHSNLNVRFFSNFVPLYSHWFLLIRWSNRYQVMQNVHLRNLVPLSS